MKQRFLLLAIISMFLAAISAVFFAARYQMNASDIGYSVVAFTDTINTVYPSQTTFDALKLLLENREQTTSPIEYRLRYQVGNDVEFRTVQTVPAHDTLIVSPPAALQEWYTQQTNTEPSLLKITAEWKDHSTTLKKIILIDQAK